MNEVREIFSDVHGHVRILASQITQEALNWFIARDTVRMLWILQSFLSLTNLLNDGYASDRFTLPHEFDSPNISPSGCKIHGTVQWIKTHKRRVHPDSSGIYSACEILCAAVGAGGFTTVVVLKAISDGRHVEQLVPLYFIDSPTCFAKGICNYVDGITVCDAEGCLQ